MSFALFQHEFPMCERALLEKQLNIQSPHLSPCWGDNKDLDAIRGKIEILITRTHKLGESDIAEWPGLKMLSLGFTGVDKVDLDACARRNLAVYYARDYSTTSVAEHAIALTLAVLRRIPQADRDLRANKFDTELPPGDQLAGKTVGILGTGAIGTCSARKFNALGCNVIGWNRSRHPDFIDAGGSYREHVHEVMQESDVVILHLPSTPATRGMVNARTLAEMRPTSILVNVARAELVDTSALAAALASGKLAGAGIDVWDTDPPSSENPLLELRGGNVVLAPHIGFKTSAAYRRLAEIAIENVGRFHRNDPTNRLLPR